MKYGTGNEAKSAFMCHPERSEAKSNCEAAPKAGSTLIEVRAIKKRPALFSENHPLHFLFTVEFYMVSVLLSDEIERKPYFIFIGNVL